MSEIGTDTVCRVVVVADGCTRACLLVWTASWSRRFGIASRTLIVDSVKLVDDGKSGFESVLTDGQHASPQQVSFGPQ